MPKKSSLKTTAAILRAAIARKDELPDQEWFAKCVGISKDYVKKIESGSAPMTEALAHRYFNATGISPAWLLAGDISARPISATGKPYGPDAFDRAQRLRHHFDSPESLTVRFKFLNYAGRLRAVLQSASRSGNFYMADYKVGKFLDALAKVCGQDNNEASNQDWFLPAIESDIADERRDNAQVLALLDAPMPPASKRPSTRKRKG